MTKCRPNSSSSAETHGQACGRAWAVQVHYGQGQLTKAINAYLLFVPLSMCRTFVTLETLQRGVDFKRQNLPSVDVRIWMTSDPDPDV